MTIELISLRVLNVEDLCSEILYDEVFVKRFFCNNLIRWTYHSRGHRYLEKSEPSRLSGQKITLKILNFQN